MFRIGINALLREEEMNNKYAEKTIRRSLRDASNPLELPNSVFIQHYRVSKPVFKYLLEVLTQSLPAGKKAFAVPPVSKLAACLRFFAEGGYQKGVGRDKDIGLAQSTFSIVLADVIDIFERTICPKWIVWPSKEEQREISTEFYRTSQLPGVIGCVDGTHVAIIPPSVNRHLYYNRKGNYSLNVMLVCDNMLRIRYVDATHPGACHDASIYNTSICREMLKTAYCNGSRNMWLLGDAGYPLEPWLLTPYRSAQPGSEEVKFNDTHAKCRNAIERTNCVIKNRWRCLLAARQLHYSPKKAIQIVNACCALHNICITYKSVFDEPSPALNPEEMTELVGIEMSEAVDGDRFLEAAQRIRANITSTL